MSLEGVAKLAQALLYEGYLLYPYQASSLKNRHRWIFGTLYPRAFAEAQHEADPWWMRAECLVQGGEETQLDVCVRFLHFTGPDVVERQTVAPPRSLERLRQTRETVAFGFAPGRGETGRVRGTFDVAVERMEDSLFKVVVRVCNLSPFVVEGDAPREARRDVAFRCALASTHAILGVRGGQFVSLIDPPAPWREAAARCDNVGTWPVLVGDPDARDMMLASPICLEDYPRVAPESPGDFFDATEIDEMLTLRVLTLTDDEKAAVRAGDARAHTMLDRTEALADAERRRLHGAGRTLRPGLRVRLTPRPAGDIFDLALAGRTATIVKLEEDYEGRIFVAVTVDDDPGRDLGLDGRPGHRFFFRLDEVEVLS